MSTSHRDLSCADPSSVSFGPLAETHSPTGYEPKDLTEEDNSILVKPMFFHRPSMMSTHDSAESIATPLLNRIWIMSKCGICWLSRVCHSFRENSVSSSSHFRESAGKLVAVFSHKRKASQETLSDREGISLGHQPVEGKDETFFRFSDLVEAARFVLEEQRDPRLAEMKSEILKQECKVDTLNTCRAKQRQAHSNRLEMDNPNHGSEKSRREQARLHKDWLNEKKHEILVSEISMKWKN